MSIDRLTAEQRFHDAQAQERAHSFDSGTAHLRFDDADYLDHETWIRTAFAKLGPLQNKHVLDYGCGHGMAAVVLARGGANVSAFDLSPGYVAEAQKRVTDNGVSVDCRVANGEALPYADASFDGIWGHAILHHLDLDKAGAELRRVLKPGGIAVFCEPWGGNPILNLARAWLPYRGKHRTADEIPLRSRDLHILRQSFPKLQWEGVQLFSMVRRVWSKRSAPTRLSRFDQYLVRNLPGLRFLCRYVVVMLIRE